MTKIYKVILAAATLITLAQVSIYGADIQWTAAGGPYPIPDSEGADTYYITTNETITTNLVVNGILEIRSGGTLNDTASFSFANNATLDIQSGGAFNANNSSASFLANSGGSATNSGTITSVAAILSITGSGSTFTNNASVIINSGILDLQGSTVINNESGGTITLNGGSSSILAQTTITNKSGGTITNNTGGTITILSAGSLSNTGVVNNNASSTIANNAGIINNSGGAINNAGDINNTGGTATFTNNGSVQNNSGGTITNTKTITNNLTFDNNSGGTIDNNSGGNFNNTNDYNNKAGSTFTNKSGATITITNPGNFGNLGTMTNESGGTINNSNILETTTGGTLNNAGEINDNTGAVLSSYTGGILNNNSGGTINHNAGTFQVIGAFNNNSGGTITNDATLTNNGGISNSGTLTNDSSGAFTNNGDFYKLLNSTFTQVGGSTFTDNGSTIDLSNLGNTNLGQAITISDGLTITIFEDQSLKTNSGITNLSNDTLNLYGNLYTYSFIENGDGSSAGTININHNGKLYLLSARLENKNAGSAINLNSGGKIYNYYGDLNTDLGSFNLNSGGALHNVLGTIPKNISPSGGSTYLTTEEINLDGNLDVDFTWTFTGHTVINGYGHQITFGTDGALYILGDEASLLLDDVILNDVSGVKIILSDPTTSLTVHNNIWNLDNNFSFTWGKLSINGDWLLDSNNKTFNYTSDQISTINPNSTMHMLFTTFNYNTDDDSRLAFANASSSLHIENTTLNATQNCKLADGTLFVTGLGTFTSSAAELNLASLDEINVFGSMRRIGNVVI